MAIKGAQAKAEVMQRILMAFDGAFMNGEKELRIPCSENGETIEIKVTLTAAKDIVGGGPAPKSSAVKKVEDKLDSAVIAAQSSNLTEPSQEEKDNLSRLLETFGL